jgi:hypothetical protein
MAPIRGEYKQAERDKSSAANVEEGGVVRRPISEAAKVVIAAVALGPPLGGIVVMALLQLVPAMEGNLGVSLPEFGKNALSAIALAIPFSYFVGAASAILGGLALAAYIAWGGRLTWWACVVASLVYPVLLGLNGWISASGAPGAPPQVLLHAALIAVGSVSGALLTYLLLRKTAFVRRLNAPAA